MIMAGVKRGASARRYLVCGTANFFYIRRPTLAVLFGGF